MSLNKRKGSPWWWYDFTITHQVGPEVYRKRFRGSCETANKGVAAQVEEAERNRQIAILKRGEKGSITLDTALARYWDEHAKHLKANNNIIARCRRLISFLGAETYLETITEDDLAAYVLHRQNTSLTLAGKKKPHKSSNNVINKELGIFQKLLKLAKRWKCNVPDVDFSGLYLKLPDPMTTSLSLEEYMAVFKELGEDVRDQIIFLVHTGVRLNNMITSEWGKNIDLKAQRAVFWGKSRLREGKYFEVELNSAVMEMLERRADKARKAHKEAKLEGRVFTVKGKPLATDSRKALKAAFRRSGVRRPKGQLYHIMRHTHATWIHELGYDAFGIRDSMKHSDLKTSLKYIHPSVKRRRERAEGLAAMTQIRHTQDNPKAPEEE